MKALISILLGLLWTIYAQGQTQPNPCLANDSFRIVVIGSSTAAGTGASNPANAWVNRYRTFLDSIQPANEVINLAQGGYNTYRLMPSAFVPPMNRPLPDTARNITKALSLNPDAIIINLPSNDAASGYGTVEQMSNFIAMYNEGVAQSVPVWVCTTQPRNFGPAAIQIQLEVRDSILIQFGNMALDFWSGAANLSNTIDPAFDSGDGVHLNDAGHGLLFEVVKQANLPGALLDTAAFNGPNLGILDFALANSSVCGDSASLYHVVVGNLGSDALYNLPLEVEVNSGSGTQLFTDTLLGGLSSCSLDTLNFILNTYSGGNYQMKAYLVMPGDTTPLNDTATRQDLFNGHPSLTTDSTFACQGDSFFLQANTSTQDTVLWYDSLSGGSLLGFGSVLALPPGNGPVSAYAQAVRGDLFFRGNVLTTFNSNINWNGCMFDLVAQDSLVIDSLALKVNSLGSQAVEWYYKSGSYQGFEGNGLAWTLAGIDTVQVTDPDEPVRIVTVPLTLLPGDTMGIYLQMANPSSNLSYLSNGSTGSFSSGELSILTGSGISHNFSNTFFPRNWNGEVFYHHGFNPNGDCTSERLPAVGIRSAVSVNLGNDTVICPSFPIVLNAGVGNTYQWSTGDTTASIQVVATGTYAVSVTELSSACVAIDTISITNQPAPVAVLPEQIRQCGGTVMLDAGNLGSDYQWSSGDTTQVVTIASSGTYTLAVSNLCANLSDTVQVYIDSALLVELGADTVVCNQAVLTPGTFPGASYLWSTGDTTANLTVQQTGNYWVEVINACGNAIDAQLVTVEAPPTAGFSALMNGGLVAFSDQGQGATQWFWDFGDGNTSNQANPVYTYANNGSFTVLQVVFNSCGSDTTQQTVEVNLSSTTSPVVNRAALTVYPNPTRGALQLRTSKPESAVALYLYNLQGQLLYQAQGLNLPTTVLLKELPSGTYLYRVTTSNEILGIGRLTILEE